MENVEWEVKYSRYGQTTKLHVYTQFARIVMETLYFKFYDYNFRRVS